MKLDNQVFRSRFAKRLISIFLLSSVLPIALLATISFNQVTQQLQAQNRKQLHQEAKTMGLAIVEKLNLLETEMALSESQLAFADINPPPQRSSSSTEYRNTMFRSLGWVDRQGAYTNLLGAPNHELISDAISTHQRRSSKATVVALDHNHEQQHIFMLKAADSERHGDGLIVSEVNPSYLFDVKALAGDSELCVLDHLGSALYCSDREARKRFSHNGPKQTHSTTGAFTWRRDDTDFITSYWDIFLRNKFTDGDWTVFLSKANDPARDPITTFQRNFVIIAIISVLAVFGLSINTVRRILVPIAKLRDGTLSLKEVDFNQEVVINSNDEFEELATAFNGMRKKLAKQFVRLETMAEIDRLILSSAGSTAVAQSILTQSQDAIICDCIGIAIADSAGGFAQLHVRQHGPAEGVTTSPICIHSWDRQTLRNSPNGVLVEAAPDAPGYLAPLLATGAQAALLLPVCVDDELSAIAMLGYNRLPDDTSEEFTHARDWLDRVAVALSHSKWQERLYHQAHYDSLTNLPNRHSLTDYLKQAKLRADRNESLFAVLFIDLDRFKLINDSIGHAVGDKYLQVVAERIAGCVRSTDMVARLGGDEFTIITSDTTSIHSLNMAVSLVTEKLLAEVPKPIMIDGCELLTTPSIGISIYPVDSDDIDDIFKNADAAMYDAKESGGNEYRYYSQELQVAATQRMQVETELRTALERDELELYYQPQVEISTGKVIGAEALVRWNHPVKGMIPPDSFIPIAEETTLIEMLDLWVLNRSCEQIRSWQQQGYSPLRTSINLSARQFQRTNIVTLISEALDRYDLDAACLELEVTEGSLLNRMEQVLTSLNALKERGVKLAIDDFGTGYSSLAYLQQLPVHKLKIDQTFMRKVDGGNGDTAIVRTIISLARNMGLTSIAEGVETEAQLALLRELGCDQAQGYLIARPLPAQQYAAQFLAAPDSPATEPPLPPG